MIEKGTNHQLIKHKNLSLIMKHIYMNSPISRVEIAQALGLTTATITGLVAPLLSEGLLEETAAASEATKGAGRPRVMLQFVSDAFYCCGVEVSPYHINYTLINARGDVIHQRKTPETLGEYDKTLDLLAREIPAFLSETPAVQKDKLLGVGICLPGLIDGEADKIYTPFQEGWTDHSLSAELGSILGIKVEVENNVRARAICANLIDRAVSAEPFAYFFSSFGVACQMIIDGRILYGKRAAAGEIGHTVVQRNGPVCPTCGNRGCLEALAGERAILSACRRVMRSGIPTELHALCTDPDMLTMRNVLDAQEKGDSEIDAILEDALNYLGLALANIINLLSPRSIIVDGLIFSTEKNQNLFLRFVSQNIFQVHANDININFLPYDPGRGSRAAASVVISDFLKNHLF